MFTSRLALAALAAAMLSIFAAPNANAAYAPPPFSAEVPQDVEPGEEFTITFDAGTINCDWSMRPFHGQKSPGGTGTTYTVTLIAPKGHGTYSVVARCAWDSEAVNPAVAPASTSNTVTPAVFSTSTVSDTRLAAMQTDVYSVEIVVGDGAANEDDGALPNTGGSTLTLLAIGGALAVAGVGITYAARRRKVA